MKAYPSIETKIDYTRKYHIFDKLDGSNIRAEWSKKSGFYKFGSRTQLLNEDQKTLWPARNAILENFSEQLSSRFSKLKAESAIAFFEWVGPESFAGNHGDVSQNRPVLIDIAIYKKGMLPPDKFLEVADGLETPTLIQTGRIDVSLFHAVRDRTLEGMTFEGVVGKGEFSQKLGHAMMFKIKSNDWLNKLKTFCNGDEALYSRLK